MRIIGVGEADYLQGDTIANVAEATMRSALGAARWGETPATQSTYGNFEALTLMETLAELRAEMKALSKKQAIDHIAAMGFLDVRGRWFATFARDIRGETDPDPGIRAGNRAAHDANIHMDAQVYLQGIRHESDGLFKAAYGVTPLFASTLGE